MRRSRPSAFELASSATLVLASAVLAATLWNAFGRAHAPETVRPASDGTVVLAGAARGGATTSTPADVVLANDPFDPHRAPPREDREPSLATRDAPSPVAVVRLLGTVVRGNASFALCQLQADPPRIVRVGEQVGDLVLVSIDQGRAAFRRRDGARIELTLTTPGA